MKTVVGYHSNCYDGWGSAYAAWKKLGDSAVYIGCTYGHTLPKFEPGTKIFFIDYCPKREQLLSLIETCQVTVLDHHDTAEKALLGLPTIAEHGDFQDESPGIRVLFDMNRSGAMISWNYFHPTAAPGKLIEYIQDRDLWKFELPFSKEMQASLKSHPRQFEVWDKLDVHTLIQEGPGILRYENQIVEMICDQAEIQKFQTPDGETYNVPVVNCTSHWSEVAMKMLDMFPEAQFSVAYYYAKNNEKVYSFRSRKDFNCSDIAAKFGGGGHPQSAGARVKL